MSAVARWSQVFANDGGGPMVVLPLERLHVWQGTASDLERASAARRPFGLLKDPPVLVAQSNERPMYAAGLLHFDEQPGCVLVGWEDGWDVGDRSANEYVQDWLAYRLGRPGVEWTELSGRMEVRSGMLLLAHASVPVEGVRLTSFIPRVGNGVPVSIAPGRYAVETTTLEDTAGGDLSRCVLCRWTPIIPAKERRSAAAAERRERRLRSAE